MSRTRARLSVVQPMALDVKRDPIAAETYREIDIEHAAQALHLAAVRLRATPRYPEIAEHRQTMKERFEAAVRLMREVLE
jgi:hypothetical protein